MKSSTPTQTVQRLRLWMAGCGLLLIWLTIRLWLPQGTFPRVPAFRFLIEAPGWLDIVALVGVVSALVLVGACAPFTATAVSKSRRLRLAAGLLVGSAGVAVLLDQHRLQPWLYQFLIVTVIMAAAPAATAPQLLRWVAVGVYVWSAVSKLDFTFLHGLGLTLLRGLLEAVGLNGNAAPESLVWAFPFGELCVATLLLFPRTRQYGLAAACLMHGLLLLTLGPWGLNHEPGVLVWNTYFIGQNWLLFGPGSMTLRDNRNVSEELTPANTAHGKAVAVAASSLAVLLPVLEPFGLLDHWPGWAVYAPGAERVSLWLTEADTNRLPVSKRVFLGPIDWLTERRPMRLDRWSLEELSVPLYPQERVTVGVAIGLIDQYELKEPVLVIEPRANRRTGIRNPQHTLELAGRNTIARRAMSYWFNAEPREAGQ